MTATVAAIAAYRLPSRHQIPPALSDDDFAAVLDECEGHRLLGFMAAAVRAGDLTLEAEQHDALEESFRGWLTHDLRVERLLLEATSVLDRAGIPSRVLKGVALAHTAYADPADRVFADVDLLVPGDSLTRAAATLATSLDGNRPQPELRPGFDDRFGKEVMLRVGTLELDLHRTFVDGAFGLTVQLDDLFAPPYRFPLGVCELEALPMPQRLLHACYASALGDWPPRFSSLRDLAQIVLREGPHLVDVLLMARAWRCEVVVAQAITMAWEELGLTDRTPLVEWAHKFEPSRADRLLMASHQGPGRSFTRHLAALGVLHGTSTRLAYVRAIAFPQRSYLEARGLSGWTHVQRAWRRIFR